MPSFNPVSGAPVSSQAGAGPTPANTLTGASTASFIEVRFPTTVSWGAVGGCDWSTRVIKLDSGWDYRQAYFAFDRGRWTVTHKFRDAADWAYLVSFFRIMNGRLLGFRFQDPTDYTSETYLGSGVTAGVIMTNPAGQLQLYKSYTLTDVLGGPQVVYRPIFKPAPDQSVTITSPGGSTVRHGWTLNCSTGVVTGGGVQANDIWSGQFDVPVRFDTDHMDLAYEFYNAQAEAGGASWINVPLVELVEPEFTPTPGGVASGAQGASMLKNYGTLSTRWHVDGLQSASFGNWNAPLGTSLTYTNLGSGGNVGGFTEPGGVNDIWMIAVVCEAGAVQCSVTGITDSFDNKKNKYKRWLQTSVSGATVTGAHSHLPQDPILNLEIWWGYPVPCQTPNPPSLSVTVHFSTVCDGAVVMVVPIAGGNHANPFDGPAAINSGVIAANTSHKPSVSGFSTVSQHPLVFGLVCGLNRSDDPTPTATNWDPNDFTDGYYAHSPQGLNLSGLTYAYGGLSDYPVELGGFFSQNTGPLQNQSFSMANNWTAFTPGSAMEWIMVAFALAG